MKIQRTERVVPWGAPLFKQPVTGAVHIFPVLRTDMCQVVYVTVTLLPFRQCAYLFRLNGQGNKQRIGQYLKNNPKGPQNWGLGSQHYGDHKSFVHNLCCTFCIQCFFYLQNLPELTWTTSCPSYLVLIFKYPLSYVFYRIWVGISYLF